MLVSIHMIDIVTVVFEQELEVLKSQARSIDLYCDDRIVGNIYIVVNDSPALLDQIDKNWWGKYHDRVCLIHRQMFSTAWSDNGWISQQALKLLASACSYNTWSMILDAKTIFIKSLTERIVFDSQERPCVGQLDVYPVFEPSRQIVNSLFNIELQKQIGPGGVPFFLHNATVRSMITHIESITQQSFPTWFQAQGLLTEFLLYSGYVQYHLGSFEKLYNTDFSNIHPCNLCHSEVSSFDRKFNEMQQSHILTVSVHRNAWNQLLDQQRAQYQDLLQARGIT